MKKYKITRSGLLLLMAVTWSMMVISQESKQLDQLTEKYENFMEQIPGERIYLHVDKSLYQAGETVWFTAYLRNDIDLKASEQSDIMHVELIDSKGNIQQKIKLINKDGIAQGDFTLDENLPEGMYQIKAYTEWQKNDKEPFFFTKNIHVQKFILPRLLMGLDFDKKSYGAGDIAKAEFEMKNLEEDHISDYSLIWEANLAGEKLASGKTTTDIYGKANIEFDLPDNLETTDGQLNIMVDYNGIREAVSKSIPIASNRIQFELYPEGGDLVNGQKTNIAFQALDENGKPTEVEGKIVDIDGNMLVGFKSFHHGMGSFEFLPELDKDYYAVITRPEGIRELFPLPEPLKKGFTINVMASDKDNLFINIQSSHDGDIVIIAQIRGKIYHSEYYVINAGDNLLKIYSAEFPIGVAQITLFDGKGIARAERLAFVNKHKQLNIQLMTDKEKYNPREKVSLNIKVIDENNLPISGSFSVAIVDENLKKMVNDNSGKILAKLLLEPDISGNVEDAAFYFDNKEMNSDLALDYLLMTRGWRRFSWKEISKDKAPPIAFNAEKAIIQGYIFDSKQKNPSQKVKIRIDKNDRIAKTNKEGYFEIEGIDLSKKATISYTNVNGEQSEYIVADYGIDHLIDVSKDYSFKEVINRSKRPSGRNNFHTASGTAAVKGQIIDSETMEPLPFANIVAEVDGRLVAGAISDDEGYYMIKPLPPGKFDLKTTYVSYPSHIIKGVIVKSRQMLFLDIELDKTAKIVEKIVFEDQDVSNSIENNGLIVSAKNENTGDLSKLWLDKGYYQIQENEKQMHRNTSRELTVREEKTSGIDLDELVVSAFFNKLIDPDQTISGAWISGDDLKHMVVRDSEAIAATVGGVFSMDGERGNIRGARIDQTAVYIDGMRVIGSTTLPPSAIASVAVYLGGIPAEYGDFRGGIIDITTKSAFTSFYYPPRDQKEETIEIPALAVYYRARDFPEVVYEKSDEMADRNDFRTTVFWKGDIELDEKGTAFLEFFNSDAISTFNITFEGVSKDGLLGKAEKIFITQ